MSLLKPQYFKMATMTLREILEELALGTKTFRMGCLIHPETDVYHPNGHEVTKIVVDLDQAESQIKAWIEENVIGEDEKFTGYNIGYAERNRFRQSQRQQLREEK